MAVDTEQTPPDEKAMVELLSKAGYSERAINYYLEKLNVGIIEDAEAVESYKGLCGDSMRIYLKIAEGVVRDAKFQAIGCAGAFASGSALTEMVKGKSLEEAQGITGEDVVEHLGKMPGPKLHCARLAVDALRKSIEKYRKEHEEQ
ncbi:iron-sulfur cluster assembly scaffold protein [Candidatus Bathyarchaeota archaeon]|nr:iron-sulfur cluster assembly scaffold protein [Candidatus Bathyarchaeota archaeon]NIU81070.1 iron-sulfur cluster assembly scaffold protein [Candidatus Bathyarchaeota archaeon]NIW16521.1 iron-sulfur cluster assembly scaffold protein [Candidatus Bathyarchaeota archaeon]NIW34663.1 iron-sulfur cluster assembly scaffold protein [Candidatus Bathyarchaeota archaeon]